jgi:cytochrome c-type biogenesis protein CcmH/NrfG
LPRRRAARGTAFDYAQGHTEHRRGTRPRRRPGFGWLLPALAAALACAAYINALDNPFVYDDHDTIIGNASLVDPTNVRFVLVYSPFRPIVNASYALDHWIWGYRPFGYHVTNVALHAAAVLLLYAWLRRILVDTGSGGAASLAAFAGAALFAVHPLQSEAVGYVSGRSELMCAVWFLAALLLARDAILSGSRVRTAGAVLCGLLAIASKEIGLVLPFVVLAYDWLLRPGEDGARRRRLWRVFVPAFVLLAGVGAYRLVALRGISTGTALGSLYNMLTQAIVIWRYVGLLVWPASQSIMHSVHRVTSVADPIAWVALAGLAGACAGAFPLRTSYPVVALGIMWFFAVLAPSSSVIALREGMAEHRVYLASAGIFIALASAFARGAKSGAATADKEIVSRWLPRDPATTWVVRAGRAGVFCAVLTVLFALTVMRNRVWSDPVALWTEATVHAEGMWEPHYALADSLREAGNCTAALPEYRAVVALRPAHRDAFTNMGICLAQTGQLEEAERSFRRVLEIDPSFPRGYTNLGALALVAGDTTRARDYYREAIAQDPRNVLARMQLASLYEKTFHDYHAAARMCGEARLLAPSTPGVVECMERNQRLAAGR